jgi:hypothetical protein
VRELIRLGLCLSERGLILFVGCELVQCGSVVVTTR